MKYEIYKGSNGEYAFTLGRYGFYNRGWCGYTQPVITDPNEPMVIKFATEALARDEAEKVGSSTEILWTKI